jgi:hypothetical protein
VAGQLLHVVLQPLERGTHALQGARPPGLLLLLLLQLRRRPPQLHLLLCRHACQRPFGPSAGLIEGVLSRSTTGRRPL